MCVLLVSVAAQFRFKLTRIDVCGADRHHFGANRYVLGHLVRVAHRIEDGRIVVQVQHIAVYRQRGRQTRMAVILGLHDEQVMLYL